jgi:pimeloyl-ACP methyl ester carboxylesterase
VPGRSLIALVILVLTAGPVQARQPGPTMVIVHGAWAGGWAFRDLDLALRAEGVQVHRPTLTGLGSTHHIASSDIGLDVHVTDIANFLLFEELQDVVLVGHSYGGMVITGVAEIVPDRIRRLVYLDAFVPRDGESVASLAPDLIAAIRDGAGERARPGFIVPFWEAAGSPVPRDVDHPEKTFTDSLELRGEPGNGLPATYVLTREAPGEPDAFDAAAARARTLGWTVLELTADHNPHWSQPGPLTALLLGITRSDGR